MLILLLHTLVEGIVGLLFLFYPNAGDLIPGFGQAEGPSAELLMNMYGLSALLLAALSLIAYFSRANRVLLLTISGTLAVFHFAMAIIQALGNPDHRAMLTHFILGIFMAGLYVQERRKAWTDVSK
ncbi:hypothetical protein [Lewinella sp. W8]|uniref:hypothetical protein n=1 Tax=Lewinella sp. W8 TaxID=2528208 RepID=UPI001067CB66|nr:hypothetical protein [Lewinella sp. W8]MTB51977.1 hypothetical protein [Lewinella sp. W8]